MLRTSNLHTPLSQNIPGMATVGADRTQVLEQAEALEHIVLKIYEDRHTDAQRAWFSDMERMLAERPGADGRWQAGDTVEAAHSGAYACDALTRRADECACAWTYAGVDVSAAHLVAARPHLPPQEAGQRRAVA